VEKIGYVCVSFVNKDLGDQIKLLRDEGCVKVFEEKFLWGDMDRPEFYRMLRSVRKGDLIVVKDFSCLAQSIYELYLLVNKIREKGCQIIFLRECLDTSKENGSLIFRIFKSFVDFESDFIYERQRERLEYIRFKRRRSGRPALKKPDNFDAIFSKVVEDKMSIAEAIMLMGISRSRFYVLREEFIKRARSSYRMDAE